MNIHSETNTGWSHCTLTTGVKKEDLMKRNLNIFSNFLNQLPPLLALCTFGQLWNIVHRLLLGKYPKNQFTIYEGLPNQFRQQAGTSRKSTTAGGIIKLKQVQPLPAQQVSQSYKPKNCIPISNCLILSQPKGILNPCQSIPHTWLSSDNIPKYYLVCIYWICN